MIPPSEFPELHAALDEVRRTRNPTELELLWPGIDRWMAIIVYPSTNGLAVFIRDVGERRRAEERQRLLMAELQHRVKNILSVVRSITVRTVESSSDLADFSAHFDGRLGALARAQAVLARRAGEDADLEQMVREELLSHAVEEQSLVVAGAPVNLRHKAAETLALTVHELATNAVKYGALSSVSGKVTVSWHIKETAAGEVLCFRWIETGVPVIDPRPARRGFGRDLIEHGLPYDLPDAKTTLTFAAGGAQCTIELPLNPYASAALTDDDATGEAASEGREYAGE